MANNRIYLVCKKDHQYYALAKYYPSSGWYTTENDTKRLNEWLEEHSHDAEKDMWGEFFYLVYETEDGVKEIDFNKKTIKIGGKNEKTNAWRKVA